MWPYWLMFLVPSIAALVSSPASQSTSSHASSTRVPGTWLLAILAVTLLLGLRFQVGTDWYNYLRYLYVAEQLSFSDAFLRSDPSYWLVNVLSSKIGWGIVGVNIIGGFIFSIGIVQFCRTLPRPWLAFSVSIPYMIIVVGMGYSRQGIALGLILLALVALEKSRSYRFLLFIFIATSFHKTAIIFVPIIVIVSTNNRFIVASTGLIASIMAYMLFLESAFDDLWSNYVDSARQSSGTFIRLAMNAFPAALFLIFRDRFPLALAEYKLWRFVAVTSLVLFAAFFGTDATTALDRIALYMIPLQLVVFSHLPDVLSRFASTRRMIVLAILTYYSFVLAVWLNFADNARYWIPYQVQI